MDATERRSEQEKMEAAGGRKAKRRPPEYKEPKPQKVKPKQETAESAPESLREFMGKAEEHSFMDFEE